MAHPVDLEAVLHHLQRTGISGYEARVYTALLAAGVPVKGYQLAKRSGVPRSMVYETLRKLVSRGLAFEVRAEDGTAYLPLQPEGLLSRLRREFEESASLLERALPEVTIPPQATVMHHVQDRGAVVERVLEMIRGASDDVWLSAWPQEAEEFGPEMREAERRGAEVFMLVFDEEPNRPVDRTYSHRFFPPDTVLERVGCRLLVAVADRRRALIGGAVGADVWGVYSEDPAVILVCVEFIRHDISYQVICERLGSEAISDIYRREEQILDLATKGSPVLRDRGSLG